MNTVNTQREVQANGSARHDHAPHGSGWVSSRWVSVGLLMLVVVVLSRVAGVMDSPAMAEMAIGDSSYTMMTTNGGADEILVLVDTRQEMIMVYRSSQTGGLDLLEKESLSGLFTRARAQAIGGP